MKFLMLVYTDDALIQALPPGEYDRMMRECLLHADELRAEGKLLDSQQLEMPRTGKSIRKRGEKVSVLDGPFAETKEILGGFNLLEAADLDEALRIAEQLPWTRTGSIEVRPVRDIDLVRDRVGAQRA